MGFFSRWKHLSRMEKNARQNPLFANSIVPTSVGSDHVTMITTTSTPANTGAYVGGPNPEMYIHSSGYMDPNRGQAPVITLQPRIPAREPWASSSVYIQNTKQSTAQPRNQVAPGQFQSKLKSTAPPMTTIRENLYDEADPNIQLWRFHLAHTPSQLYFDEKVPLPEFTTPAVYAHSVQVGEIPGGIYPSMSQTGWEQSFINWPGPRQNQEGVSPPWLLSTPLNVKQRTYTTYDTNTTRQPLKAKAPKRRKAGG